ncbi:MAG: serine/threonine protein kinase [Planctomycetes bacterium]|nr:serine/threonine protein kinase [Planctomycetota bacterium]
MSSKLPAATVCTTCGTVLAPGTAPGGLCPSCLLGLGLSSSAAGREFVVTGGGEELPPPAPEELAPFFPQYEVVALVGRGGMGAVYRARQKGLDRDVAIKVLPEHAAKDPAFAERFAREGRALAKLNHANIVNIYDSGRAGELFYFVMEFVDGSNVRQVIRARNATPKDALAIVGQVCDALQYAHEEGVVHRDIKPENILIDKRGRVKIADFGLAKLFGGAQPDVTLTRSQQTMGTPHYMAPEQWERPSEVDHRADIYALGVVFYELLTGELPLGRFALPSQKLAVDAQVDEVVLKTLAKDPALRYQSVSAVRSEVTALAARPSPAAPRKRGCIGGLVHRIWFALDPFTRAHKQMFGMPLSSNWIPLGLVAFLWTSAVLAEASVFLWFAAVIGTLMIIRKTK